MFPKEVLSETQWNCLDCVRFGPEKADCAGYGLTKMYLGAVARR